MKGNELLEYVFLKYFHEVAWAISALLDECFGDTLEYRVLKVLSYHPQGMSMCGLTRVLGEPKYSLRVDSKKGYVGRLRRVLEALEGRGIIVGRQVGRAKVYSLNGGIEGRLIRFLLMDRPKFGLDIIIRKGL